uniref:Uncharacterized protein n=1 Tax=Arundo donax TaxID=35708 RepID=A0A0A9D653_ARUDO
MYSFARSRNLQEHRPTNQKTTTLNYTQSRAKENIVSEATPVDASILTKCLPQVHKPWVLPKTPASRTSPASQSPPASVVQFPLAVRAVSHPSTCSSPCTKPTLWLHSEY